MTRFPPKPKLFSIVVLLIGIACFNMRALGEDPEIRKVWSFHGKSGPVNFMLTESVNAEGSKATVLHIAPEHEPSSVSEEAGFLAKALEDMRELHIDPQSINWISLRLSEPDAISKVALEALGSAEWRRAVKAGPSRYYPLVTRFLNESGAYAEWERVFQKYGSSLKVAGVEKVGMEPFAKLQQPCPKENRCERVFVPIDALILMDVTSVSR